MTQAAPAYLEELNDAQRRAATAPDGPVLVIAGAGTGKTKTLAARVAWLLDQGLAPERILLLTFTRRAAQEMLSRAGKIVGANAAGKVWGGTFHAMANRLLRQHARSLALSPEFTVIDQADGGDLMHVIRTELGLGKEKTRKRRFPQKSTLMGIYSYMVNARKKLSEVLATQYPWCAEDQEEIKRIIELYTRRKREQNVLDYDDLLLYWKALAQAPQVGALVADQFEHVLVDEYQDTNLVQAEILQALRKTRKNIMVVGDDAQSIYSFRAATIRNILDFPLHFPGATTITLEQNYRSVQPILDASNAIMSQATERYTKNLFSQRSSVRKPALITCMDEAEQTDEVCRRILDQLEQHIPLRRQAVLFRTGHHSDALEVELTRRNIPFIKFGGLKFIEAAHIKDMLALLRLLVNPADEISWYRLLGLLQGVGPATAAKLVDSMNIRGGTSDSVIAVLARALGIPPAALPEFTALKTAMLDCSKITSPASTIERLRRFYEPIFKRIYDHPKVRLRDLEQLEQIATTYKSRTQFITDLTLDPPSSTADLAGPPLLEEDWITLSTIHSAKGLEWDAVHILHCADGMIPSDMSTGSQEDIDEERRLLYVAMTRARDTLSLYFPLRYHHRARGKFTDQHTYAQLTRFIPESACPHFERIAAPRVQELDAPALESQVPTTPVSIDGMLNDLLD